MNQVQYLKALEEALGDRLEPDQRQEILRDYQGFFLSGLAEGKTEEAISEALGNPEEAAAALLEQEPGAKWANAPLSKRILALIIDLLLAAGPFSLVAPHTAIYLFFSPQTMLHLFGSIWSTLTNSGHDWIQNAIFFWKGGLILALFWFFLIHPLSLILFKGRALGKAIMGLQVIHKDGSAPAPSQLLVRELVGKYALNGLGSLLPSLLAFAPSLASLAWASMSLEGRTLHDTVAQTRVVLKKHR